MNKINKNIPKLRFPGFLDQWEISKLKKVASLERGRFSPRPRNDPTYYGGDIPFVQTSDVVTSNGYISSYSQTLNDKGLKVSKLFPKGTILITIAANIGYTGVLQIDMACPDSLIGIKCYENIDNYYLRNYLLTQQKYMEYISPEAAQKNINIEFLAPYLIPFPSLPEQKKVATFLSAVDKKIQCLIRKKELLEQYKKGVMQKIFSQEIRFTDDDGNDFPDWEEKRLGEVSKFLDSQRIPLSEADRLQRKGKYPYYGASGIIDYIDDCIFDGEYVLLAEDGANIINRSTPIAYVVSGKIWVNNHAHVIEPYGSAIFLAEKLESLRYDNYNTGTAQPKLNAEVCKNIIINIPCNEEQNKIAEFLLSVNKKIKTLDKIIIQTEQFKKGLLQGMFV